MRAGGQCEIQRGGEGKQRGAAVGVDGWGDEGDVFEAEAFVAEVDCALDICERKWGWGGAARGVVGGGVHTVEGGD